jgi:hypothetical protein
MMLLSPRPANLLPSPVTSTQGTRSTYVSREDGYMSQSPRQNIQDTASNMIIPVSSIGQESSRQPWSRRESSPPRSRPELPRPDSVTSVKSRESTSSLNRTFSRDSISSMKRTMSRDSTSSRKGPRQFVVKSKASRSHRTAHLARTPSYGKGLHQINALAMTHTPSPKREQQDFKPTTTTLSPSAGNQVRRKALSMSTQEEAATPPLIRRTLSDENGITLFYSSLIIAPRFRRSSSETISSPANRARRPSNLAREAVLDTKTMQQELSDDDDESQSESDSEDETIEMHSQQRELRRPEPPTLQLRRTSTNSATASSPRVSGLSGIAHTPPQFAQLTQPGPAPVAPPFLTTTSAVITDLPYAPTTSGSSSLVRERITRLQHGDIGLDHPQKGHTESTSADSSSPVEERSSATATTSTSKPVSLENTRYALDHQAQDMIRRLSNGPPGALRRSSSPSPPSGPSGWRPSERITRTMQKQVIYRDLLQEATEQHHGVFSPMITRPDSRSDYFSVPPSDNLPNTSLEDDPFLTTMPRLNSELRRITKELDNVKKFSDPIADALQRLAQRKGLGSPIMSTTNPQGRNDSLLSLTSSWKKRFSPDKRSALPDTATVEPSRSPHPGEDFSSSSTAHDYQQGADVFRGERESKLREVTRQLWESWPERRTLQESEEVEQTEEQKTEQDARSQSTTSISPTETRGSRSQSPVERRLFGSGLRETWGSALALAGLR